MSKRAEMRARQRRRRSRQRMILVGGVALLALVVAGAAIWLSNKPVGEIVLVESKSPPYSNGKILGAADAPVVIQDFSNFT